MPAKEMTLLDHLEELRWCLVKIIIGLIIPTIVALFFYKQLFQFMLYPITHMGFVDEVLHFLGGEGALEGTNTPAILQAINPTDTFLSAIKISVTVGIFVSCPWIIYQLWTFVSPALNKTEKGYTLPVVFFASLFFLTGSIFAYFIVLPFALNFLANFGGDLIKNQWTITNYFDLILTFILSFGLVFEMPLLAYILAKLDIITEHFLRKYRRYAIIVILILAATLTPPDVISQVMMAVPLLLLYEVSIWVVSISRPKTPFDDMT